MRLTSISFLLLLLPVFSVAQPTRQTTGIRGSINSEKGEPLPFAGISVTGTNLGTLANSEGVYELLLEPGDYTLHFQYLGFRTEVKDVSIGNDMTLLNVSMQEQALTLRELQVGKDTEDPAYTIMRKAIAKAGYHQLQIRSYSASVYARSTAVPTKIPFLMKNRLKKQGISENIAFVNESVTKVDFKRPNSYTQKIISTQNNVDNSTPTPNEFIFASFYHAEVAGTVTPLSPKAFSVYDFEYEGHFEDRGEIVNKIKVTPKSFKQGVFKGSIYIIDERWAIHSFNLQTIWQGFGIQVKQLFARSQDIWIPASQHFDIKGSYLGFAGKFTYVVTIQYDKLDVDQALKQNITIVDTKKEPGLSPNVPDKEGLKNLLASGQKADTKSFRKIVKQYEKEQKKIENPEKSNREVRRDSIIVEPLANKRDSAYWASIRSVPLTQTEVVSYHVSDSIVAVRAAGNRQADTTRFKPLHLLSGARYRYGNGRSFSLNSPLRTLSFNPVEAFNFDLSGEWKKIYANKTSLRVNPYVHYSTGRNRISPRLKLQMDLGVRRFILEGGEQVSQFNTEEPIPPVVNSLYYLLFNQNHIRLFQKQFARIVYQQREILDMIDFTSGIEVGKRDWLQNQEKRGKLLRGDPGLARNDNTPDYMDYPSYYFSPDSRYAVFSARFDIRPWQKYSVRNGRKRFFSNSQPAFTIRYRKGIPLGISDVDYDLLEGSVRYDPKVFQASTLQIKVSGGRFINNRLMAFPDFKHFIGNQTVFQTGDHLSAFRMLPYYQYSTPRNYIQAHGSLHSPKLLLTQLPLVRMIGLKEYIQGHMLHTPNTFFYTEQVYGLDGILKIFRLEFVTHFDQDQFLGAGIRLGTIFNF